MLRAELWSYGLAHRLSLAELQSYILGKRPVVSFALAKLWSQFDRIVTVTGRIVVALVTELCL